MSQAQPVPTRKRVYRCSFCGKSQEEVATLVAGPGVFICDECVQLCQAIIVRKAADRGAPDALLPDNAPTEKLLTTLAEATALAAPGAAEVALAAPAPSRVA